MRHKTVVLMAVLCHSFQTCIGWQSFPSIGLRPRLSVHHAIKWTHDTCASPSTQYKTRRFDSGLSKLSMGFLGFDFSELSLNNLKNLIIQAEGVIFHLWFNLFYSLHATSVSHILITGPESEKTCQELRQLILRGVNIPAGIGIADSFAKVCPKSRIPHIRSCINCHLT